jgi:hypothetical protein
MKSEDSWQGLLVIKHHDSLAALTSTSAITNMTASDKTLYRHSVNLHVQSKSVNMKATH